MLEAVRKSKAVSLILLLATASGLSSCATKEVALVKDPDAKEESMIPWNRQEKWEAQGQFSGMTDRR